MNKLKVLLIDDNESDQVLLKRFLSRLKEFQFDIKTAMNSKEALSINSAFRADIAFVDYFLGNETGLDIIHLLKNEYSELDCILLTGHGDESVVSEAFKAGASDYISKTELNTELIERSFRYISDKRTKRAELIKLERQLLHSQKMKSLGLMAGGIAHDFNNLFTVVLGQLNLLEQKISNPSNVKSNIKGIYNATERATKLSNQMLAFSGKGTFVLKSYKSMSFNDKILKQITEHLPKSIELESSFPSDTCHIEIDFSQIKTSLFSIIENSIEAMSNTGKLKLNCFFEDVKNIESSDLEHFYELKKGTYYVIEITDSGKGISSELFEKVFEPFYTSKFQGRGLGLSESLGILKSHKGTIKFKEVDKGTTVQIFIPISEKTYSKSVDTAVPTDKEKNSILIIDDEKAVLDVSKEILEYAGFNVLTALSGEHGISTYIDMQEGIKAILIDMTMPGISGLETMEKIRKINKDAYVILTSGYSKDDALSDVSTISPSDFLQKPFSPKSLIETFQGVSPVQ